MAILFLANISNNVSNAVSAIGAGEDSTVDPLDITAAASGPRSEINVWSPTSSTGAGLHFTYDTTEWAVDYLVITRMDWLYTYSNVEMRITQESSGGTITDYSAWAGVTPGTLYGPRQQDYVLALSTTSGQRYGNGVAFRDSSFGSVTYQTSDIAFCESYTIGDPAKQPPPTMEYISSGDTMFMPYEGYYPLATEKRMVLNWPILDRDEMAQFEQILFNAKPLRVPFFLWDSNGDLFPHKLEHVIIETYQVSWHETADHYSLQITFRRLKHYQ